MLVGMHNAVPPLENSLADPQPVKHRVTKGPTPRYIPQRNENTAHKNLYMNVHSNISHNRQKWKQLKCPLTDEWINRMWYIHTMDYYSAIKRNSVSQGLGYEWVAIFINALAEL